LKTKTKKMKEGLHHLTGLQAAAEACDCNH
jgi:hypothetical protein